jgi:hypothetical protein
MNSEINFYAILTSIYKLLSTYFSTPMISILPMSADHRFQHVQAVVSEYFGESFKRLNYTVRDLQTNQNEVIKNVLANTVNNSNRYGGILSPEVINNWFASKAYH